MLTIRAAQLLARADAVVHDRLVSDEILAMAAPWAEVIDVGKLPGDHRVSQSQINDILVDRGRRYDCVVRLKGGDPFVFGRGGEEIDALHVAGIVTDVVPGVSSALAGPAAIGVALTSRHTSSGFTVVTAHQDPATDRELDWDALARLGTTLVILMGAARRGAIAHRLIAGGMSPATPVAVVTNATCPDQTETRTDLARLAHTDVANPSVIVIGAAAGLDHRTGSAHHLTSALLAALGSGGPS